MIAKIRSVLADHPEIKNDKGDVDPVKFLKEVTKLGRDNFPEVHILALLTFVNSVNADQMDIFLECIFHVAGSEVRVQPMDWKAVAELDNRATLGKLAIMVHWHITHHKQLQSSLDSYFHGKREIKAKRLPPNAMKTLKQEPALLVDASKFIRDMICNYDTAVNKSLVDHGQLLTARAHMLHEAGGIALKAAFQLESERSGGAVSAAQRDATIDKVMKEGPSGYGTIEDKYRQALIDAHAFSNEAVPEIKYATKTREDPEGCEGCEHWECELTRQVRTDSDTVI